jgi:hypothetical protein
MTPTSQFPINKVSYSTLAGLLTAAIFWGLRRFAGVEIDAEGMTVITALVAGFVGYMTPIAKGEITQTDQRITEAQ